MLCWITLLMRCALLNRDENMMQNSGWIPDLWVDTPSPLYPIPPHPYSLLIESRGEGGTIDCNTWKAVESPLINRSNATKQKETRLAPNRETIPSLKSIVLFNSYALPIDGYVINWAAIKSNVGVSALWWPYYIAVQCLLNRFSSIGPRSL